MEIPFFISNLWISQKVSFPMSSCIKIFDPIYFNLYLKSLDISKVFFPEFQRVQYIYKYVQCIKIYILGTIVMLSWKFQSLFLHLFSTSLSQISGYLKRIFFWVSKSSIYFYIYASSIYFAHLFLEPVM